MTSSPAAALTNPQTGPARVASVDTLRGFVMVLMALDHTREFFTAFAGNPLDPARTTLALFTTRWITHVCAPVFVFLAGTSIFLQRGRRTNAQLTSRLLTRGVWLILLELTLVSLVFNFNWRWNVQLLEVIWAIGASMIVIAPLVWLPTGWAIAVASLLILGHNALDGIRPESWGYLSWLWRLLHVPGPIAAPPKSTALVIVAYPLLPWIGVMALGYAFGQITLRAKAVRLRWEAAWGVLLLCAFVALRWSNLYGDPGKWTTQANGLPTLLSFLNVQKYPPSLLFLLATLGIAALVLAVIDWTDGRPGFRRVQAAIRVYGQVPLFYFVLHLALIHLLAIIIAAVTGGDWRWWIAEIPAGGVLTGRPPGWGYSLPVVWCLWIVVVVLCYPACKWYRQFKTRSRNPIFSYL